MKSPFERINALSEIKVIAIIMVVTAVSYLALINADPLPDIMEARNLVAARECIEDGNCFVPTVNGVMRVRKPPLPTWVTAAAFALSGTTNNIYSARAPVIFLISLTALFVYLTARRFMDKSLALMAALMAVTFVVMQNEARRTTWDIFTTTFAFGGIWALLHAFVPSAPKENEPAARKTPWLWIIIAVILWSLSILSKGPLSVYSVFVPFIAAMALSKDRKSYRWWVAAAVIIVAVLIGSSWWGYVYLAYPEITAKLSGEVGSWTSKHKNGPLYYLFRLPILLFPWALALVGTIILPYIKGRDGRAFLNDGKKEQIRFFIIWLVVSFILLSLAPQKKYRYLIGMLMPASLALAFFIGELRERGIKGIPSSLGALWTLHTIQLPLGALGLTALTVYSFTNLNTPPWLLLFIIPLALLFYISIRYWRSVAHVALATVFLMVLTSFVAGLNARDYLTRGGGGGELGEKAYDLNSALKVGEDTCGQTLYAFRDDIRIVWITGRTNIPIREDTIIEELPALVITNENDESAFRKWADTKKLTFFEMYRFRYKDVYRIYKIKRAGA